VARRQCLKAASDSERQYNCSVMSFNAADGTVIKQIRVTGLTLRAFTDVGLSRRRWSPLCALMLRSDAKNRLTRVVWSRNNQGRIEPPLE
jgi:hypothetical protein